jgi:glucokinase
MRRNGRIDATDVVDAARKGDPLAGGVWDETCRYLAMACVNLKHLLDPQRIILAGGMSAAGDDLLRPVRDHFGRLARPDVGDRPEIVLASLGNDAGFVGAALLAMEAVAAGGGA